MTSLEVKRQLFTRILKTNLAAYKQGLWKKIEFPDDLGKQDPDMANWVRISDISLRAAWLFADDFFDAVFHGFDNLHNGWSIERDLSEIKYIIERVWGNKKT